MLIYLVVDYLHKLVVDLKLQTNVTKKTKLINQESLKTSMKLKYTNFTTNYSKHIIIYLQVDHLHEQEGEFGKKLHAN